MLPRFTKAIIIIAAGDAHFERTTHMFGK